MRYVILTVRWWGKYPLVRSSWPTVPRAEVTKDLADGINVLGLLILVMLLHTKYGFTLWKKRETVVLLKPIFFVPCSFMWKPFRNIWSIKDEYLKHISTTPNSLPSVHVYAKRYNLSSKGGNLFIVFTT